MRAEVEQWQPRVVVLDGSVVIDIECFAIKALTEAERNLAGRGITVWLAGLNPTVMEMIRRSELGSRPERRGQSAQVFGTVLALPLRMA